MAEKKEMRTNNIKRATEIVKDSKFDELFKLNANVEKDVKSESNAVNELSDVEISDVETEEEI